jgi:GTP diphosphokinase / guanosine-3',5'-bis(diphosphate) 3'-diphosphatase
MSTLERAIQIAAKAHSGQIDKAGEPYILHPLRMMLAVQGESERIVAVLHDVVEDTDVTIEKLIAEGFSTEVIEAIANLTKLPGESRLSAAYRAAANPIARVVKLADNADNMDLSRIPNPTAKDWARLEEYKAVRTILLSSNSKSTQPQS